MEKNWHNFKVEEIFLKLNSSHDGLTSGEVSRRIEKYGQNKLPEAKTDGLSVIFFANSKVL